MTLYGAATTFYAPSTTATLPKVIARNKSPIVQVLRRVIIPSMQTNPNTRLTTLKTRSNALGFALLHGLETGGLVSPLSITTALTMVAGGGDENTQRLFCQKLGVESVDELSGTLHSMLNTDSKVLNGGNAVFAESSYKFNPSFEAHIKALDGSTNTSFEQLTDAEETINDWVNTKTDGMIPRLVNRAALEEVHLILLNAISFKAKWAAPFDTEATRRNEPFHYSSSRKKVDLMTRTNTKTLVHRHASYTAISLPYSATFSMMAYLPVEEGSVSSVLQALQDDSSVSFEEERLSLLAFPAFDLEGDLELKSLLTSLGYPLSGSFSAMGEGDNLIGAILHRAKIKVDEVGTQAAAATAVMMMRRSLPEVNELIFNRPFVFAIMDADQTAVFTGTFQ